MCNVPPEGRNTRLGVCGVSHRIFLLIINPSGKELRQPGGLGKPGPGPHTSAFRPGTKTCPGWGAFFPVFGTLVVNVLNLHVYSKEMKVCSHQLSGDQTLSPKAANIVPVSRKTTISVFMASRQTADGSAAHPDPPGGTRGTMSGCFLLSFSSLASSLALASLAPPTWTSQAQPEQMKDSLMDSAPSWTLMTASISTQASS